MSDGQWCDVRKVVVSRGECNACNRHYRDLGVYPFLRCMNDHAFKPIEAVCQFGSVLCPLCKQPVVPEVPTGGGFCCDHVVCSASCDWYMNPDRCNLARDPKDARKFFPKRYDLVYPETGEVKTINLDGYRVAMHQIDNQELMRVSDTDLAAIGKRLSTAWTKTKFLHRGSADQICKEIQDTYNAEMAVKYPRVKVQIDFIMKPGGPEIRITGANSVTAWFLHELVPYVSF